VLVFGIDQIQEVIKGWYIPSRPDEAKDESTAWYAAFWRFCAVYPGERFGKEWRLSPEQPPSIHGGSRTAPKQLLGFKNDLATCMTLLEFSISIANLGQRIDLSDRDLKVAGRQQPS